MKGCGHVTMLPLRGGQPPQPHPMGLPMPQPPGRELALESKGLCSTVGLGHHLWRLPGHLLLHGPLTLAFPLQREGKSGPKA